MPYSNVSSVTSSRAPRRKALSPLTPLPPLRQATGRIDFRKSVPRPDRERVFESAFEHLERLLDRGEDVDILWPADDQVAFLRRVSGVRLAERIGYIAANRPARRVRIHLRNAMCTELVRAALPVNVQAVVHVLPEEAALLYERHLPAPDQRLEAAVRLRDAGVHVLVAVAETPRLTGWRRDCEDLLRACARARLGPDLRTELEFWPELTEAADAHRTREPHHLPDAA